MAQAAVPRRGAVVLAAGIVALAYGAVAVFSAFDRASETRPEFARMVPAAFASQALRSAGRLALAKGEGAEAKRLGEAAVNDAPLEPESTALLGAARYATGERGGADRAFRIAARLGWRIPYTQLYLLGRALESGDFRLGSLRLDALARQNPDVLGDRRLFDPFERSAPGRAALVDRLATRPPWLHAYATAVAELPPERVAARTAVLRELAARGAPIGCQEVGPLVSRLVDGGQVRDAAQLWRANCPAAAHGLIYDGNFANAAIDQTQSRFAWFFVGQSDASVVLEPAAPPPAKSLVIDSTAPGTELVVRQLTLLDPGAYRLSWRADAQSGVPADQILVGFSCNPDPRDWLTPSFDRGTQRWTVDLTMDAACPARWLGFAVKPGSTGTRLSDVRLQPAAQ